MRQGVLRTGTVWNGLEGSHGSARFVRDSHGTAVEASRGNSRSGAVCKGLARRGAAVMARIGTARRGVAVAVRHGMSGRCRVWLCTAVMVWKSRLGKSGRCKDGRGPQKVTINDGFSHGSEGLGSAGRGLEWQSGLGCAWRVGSGTEGTARQSRRVKLWRCEAWRGCRG